ncbi:YheC/YheD family protein [Virgibacillus salexigens]|uniref:YheC/YheD family protein n=1 Tax=Virgibacillus salexigens TaxID=61016 RepID=UPI00190D7876|nr:YheC/YheD family protein [Virgibacillus salexigens]
MNELTDQQLSQVNNIVQTLLEATEHFHELIKRKEMNQSIYTLSSIVEGFSSVSNVISSHSNELDKKRKKLEAQLLQTAQLLEKGNTTKISEVLQFTLLPLLKSICDITSKEFVEIEEDKVCTIGVFSSHGNPRRFIPNPRLNALIQESERQHARLLFFESTDIDFTKNEINADICVNSNWERIRVPFPDVINNVGTGKRSLAERKLRRVIPFTSYHVGNKFQLPKLIAKHRKYAELLVPFQLCRNENIIFEFLQKNNKVVFKALSSNRGENIFFVTKKGSRYILSEHKKEKVLSYDAFTNWLRTVILGKKDRFIIQRYIHTRTKNGEPYHIRAHVQKNGEGLWVLTHIYPRVGNKKSNLSNVATDGRVEDFHAFLEQEFGKNGATYEHDILRLSLELAQYLDKLHYFALDELGIDLAIDEHGKYWMHEANNGPQTAYHEEKRAINTIAYARYIAKNKIVHKDTVVNSDFQANISNLAFAPTNGNVRLAVLEKPNININKEEENFLIELAQTARKEEVNFFTFTPNDIDYNEMLIKGNFFENGKWVAKIVTYPEVIYDRTNLRGNTNVSFLYGELSDIQFINKWPVEYQLRSNIYQNLLEEDNLANCMPAFKSVTRTRDIFQYLDKYKKVMLRTETGSFLGEAHYIKKMENGKYQLSHDKSCKVYNELPLLNKFKKLISETNLVIQEDPRENLNTISVHLMENPFHEWEMVSSYVKLHSCSKSSNEKVSLTNYLHSKEDSQDMNHIEKDIRLLSSKAASSLKRVYGEKITEVVVELGLDESKNLFLLETHPLGPNYIYDKFELSKHIIRYVNDFVTK